MPEIVELLASPVHRLAGRPADGPAPAPPGELVDTVEIRAGLGIVGDRYFARPAHRDAAVTVIAPESLPAGAGLAQVRRNILVAGIGVDVTVGPGTWRALRGRGGIRCTPLNDGVLRVGPVTAVVTQPS
jgi:hypothetical protein